MSINFFYGQEYFLLEKEIKALKLKYLNAEFSSLNYRVFDNPSPSVLLDCCQNAPLMFGDVMNVIYIESYVIGAESSLTDVQLESFEFALKNVASNVHLVFVCKINPDENKKPDARKKFFKILSNYANIKEFTRFKSYQKELQTVIFELAKENVLKISSDVCSYLVEQIGTDLMLINSEIEKLKVAIHPEIIVTKEHIKKYCTSTEDIFQLVDLIIANKNNEVIKEYNSLIQTRHPLEILAVLQSGLSRYIFIKTYEKTMSNSEIASKLKIHEFIVKLCKEKIAKVSLKQLINIKHNFVKAEYQVKTGDALLPEVTQEVSLLKR